MNCKDCGYYWKEEHEDYAGCHYTGVEEWAPCNQEEEEEIEDRYTYDDLGGNWY